MKDKIPIHNYKDIVNAINEALMIVGEDGTIIMVNGAMEQLSGFSREELVGTSCSILNCDACEIIKQKGGNTWCTLFKVGQVEDRQCVFMKKDGTYASVIKNASLLKDDQGRLIGSLETFKDNSEAERKEQINNEHLKFLNQEKEFYGMVGKSGIMQEAYQVILKAAQSDSPVIIYGESGTGKELVAYAIHKIGSRKNGPFIQFNCAALNESLLESELFGHIKGAFTGAYRHRIGRFEAANGGDIFLDEIGDTPMPIQTKLLRVLETKQFERVGDHRPIRADVRVISATNKDLEHMISQGKFRKDLFFRINVIPIYLPTLKERKEDIPSLINAFSRKLSGNSEKKIDGVSNEVMDLFLRYDWPGNIRELKSTIEYAYVIADSGLIEPQHLPANLQSSERNNSHRPNFGSERIEDINIDEKTALVEALRQSGGNKTKAAEILGVHRMTVWNRMNKYGISLTKNIE